ncbi:MAG: aminotransferase class IV [Bacteroidetes bacterium]|jgi:branched-chain amino acid aminotransferase|nr:aminotransferase class IV [Bacteroidota bacterium]MDA0981261.1 aminotransferase class IV [Bacteroidota bacterium]
MIHGTHNAEPDKRNNDVLIYINGDLFKRAEAKISVFDSGYLVGDGVWEAMRLYNGVLAFSNQHLDRLWAGAASIGMEMNFSREELLEKVHLTLDANDMHTDVHVRIMLTRGTKTTPSQDPRLLLSGPNLVIIAEHKKASKESSIKGVTLFTSTVRRGSPDYLDPRMNCHSKIHEVQALVQALEAGCDEALMLDVRGFVSTCNATNFFLIRKDEVWTSTGAYCMNGITRNNVIHICEQEGIVCRQKDFSLFDTYSADEAFVTGSFGGLTPVTKIDGRVISSGAGPVTQQLQRHYKELITNEAS